jgi:hypothetical protein
VAIIGTISFFIIFRKHPKDEQQQSDG